jgi:hypothetical protein
LFHVGSRLDRNVITPAARRTPVDERRKKVMKSKRAVTLSFTTLCVVLLCGLGSAVAQTEWVQYPGNPVFNPPPGAQRAIAWDGSMYHMIFDQDDGLGHATSPDGVEWTMDPASPILTPGSGGAWDSGSLGPGAMMFKDGLFHLWYTGGEGVGYATSPDGSVWTKYAGNPLLDGVPGAFDGYGLEPRSVVYAEGAYRMWYTALDQPSGHLTIGYAESLDQVSWTRYPTPVVDSGREQDSAWDFRDVWGPSVVYDGSGYQMWYSGAGPGWGSIGYAWSTDGIVWSKHPDNPVIDGALISGASASDAVVVFDGWTYHMWYLAGGGVWNFHPNVINYATSDGLTGRSIVQVIPAAALASGANGSSYRTDVDLNNAGDLPVEYDLLWLPFGEANTNPLRSGLHTLAPGRSERYTNVLAEAFGIGPDARGALLIRASGPGLLATSRTCSTVSGVAEGTLCKEMPAVAITDFVQPNERQRLLFAEENEHVRFNIACQNGSDRPIVIILDLFDQEGSLLDRKRMSLPAWGNNERNRVFKDFMPVSGYVDVWTKDSGGSFTCYGSVVDNLTNYPMTVLPQ